MVNHINTEAMVEETYPIATQPENEVCIFNSLLDLRMRACAGVKSCKGRDILIHSSFAHCCDVGWEAEGINERSGFL